MLYFATVSFAEASQRLAPKEGAAWRGFLGVGDPILGPLPREALLKLKRISQSRGEAGTSDARRGFEAWITLAIATRNIAGLAAPERHNLYPVDLDALVEQHALLGMSRDQVVSAMPLLRGMAPPPVFAASNR